MLGSCCLRMSQKARAAAGLRFSSRGAQGWIRRWAVLLLLLATGCGGGGSAPGGIPTEGPVPISGSTSVRLTVNVPRQEARFSTVGSTVSRVQADLSPMNSETPCHTASADIPDQQTKVDVSLSNVLPGAYDLAVWGMNSDGQPLMGFRQQVQVTVGQATKVVATLEPIPTQDPPVAVDDDYSTQVDTQLGVPAATGVMANDTTLNGTVALTTPPTSGSVTLQGDGSFLYAPQAGFEGSVTFGYTLTDPGGSDSATVTILVEQGPPTAVDDAYTMMGNTQLTLPAATGVLANDIVLNGTASLTTPPSSGSVNLQGDGSFTYVAEAGFQGAATFGYTLTNSGGSSSATVTITVSGRGWFVRNDAPAGGDGTLLAPFDTLAAGVGASAPGDLVFVFAGDGTSTGLDGPVTLQPNQKLIGEATGLMFGGTEIVPPGARPVLSSSIRLADDTRVSGIQNDNPGGAAFFSHAASNLAVTDCVATNLTDDGVDFADSGGDVEISNCRFDEGYRGISVWGDNLPASTVKILNNQVSGSWQTGIDIDCSAPHVMTLEATGNTCDAPEGDGINVQAYSGATLNATLTDNVVSDPDTTGILIGSQAATSNLTVRNCEVSNVVSGSGIAVNAWGGTAEVLIDSNTVAGVPTGNGIEVGNFAGAKVNAVILGNTCSGISSSDWAVRLFPDGVGSRFRARVEGNQAPDAGMLCLAQLSALVDVGFIDNVLAGGDTIRVQATNGATNTAAIRGNQLAGGLIQLVEGIAGSPTLNVEELANLGPLNNGASVSASAGVGSVPAGTADLP
ncbi:MAG: cadherin-like domain-containing protein [Armatimonadetes bacterium]|nr:cadherin-like domain-containing protein [Armatimonadota bacterium]